jgi:hypothetical protein
MISHVQNAADLLFPDVHATVGECVTLNVKFFRGTSSEVTAEQLASQLELADDQIRSGTAARVDNIDA